MKAAVINSFGKPEVLEVIERPIPKIKSNQILVKAFAGCINPIDWKQRNGNHKFILGSPFPIVLGYDVSGIIDEVGKDVTKFKAGDKVCGVLNNRYGGAYAEYVVGEEKCFTLMKSNMDFTEAAIFPMVSLTVYQAFRDKLKLKRGQSILVNGAAGGVGHVAVQLANHFGAKVTAVTSESHYEFVQNFDPYEMIDYKKVNILKLDKKFDIFFDAVGVYSYLKTKHLLNKGGRYYTTLPRPKLIAHKIIALLSEGYKVKTSLMKYDADDLRQILEWVEKGILKVKIDKTFSLNDIAKAHKYAEEGRTEGKICIQIR